ncbi:MAG: type II toxin-antitoxin system VapC family toxin [Solirubrobacterales bacterium]
MRFADTSFWFALAERGEPRHAAAKALLQGARRTQIVVSNHVVGETWTLLRRRSGHAAGLGFLERLSRLVNVEVVHIDEATENDAWEWLRRHDEREYSFVDATSFGLMRARGIREAFAFDGDFSAAGFIEVRPPD